MSKKKIHAAQMAGLLSSNIANARSQEQLLNTPASAPPVEQVVIDNAATEQAERLRQAVSENGTVRHLNTKPDRQSRLAGKIKDTIAVSLDKYISPKSGSSERIQALAKVVDCVIKQPTKDVLDSVLAFFIKNCDNDLLQENNALKNITELDITIHHRVRIFYTVMMELARGTATKKTISIEIIRNIFKTDDFPNWVAVKIAKRR
jgi:hypothetical protein